MFDDINKAIESKLQERKMQADADCAVPVITGLVMSKPGTEKILLKTVDLDFMTCISATVSYVRINLLDMTQRWLTLMVILYLS